MSREFELKYRADSAVLPAIREVYGDFFTTDGTFCSTIRKVRITFIARIILLATLGTELSILRKFIATRRTNNLAFLFCC